MKAALIALALVAASAVPSFAATQTVVETRSATSFSPFQNLGLSENKNALINLTDGDYVSNFVVSGFSDGWSSAFSRIWVYSKTGGYLGYLAVDYADNQTGGPISANDTTYFTVTDAANKLFVWDSGVTAWGGTVSYTATISRVAQVPGPEAGAGLGALAMGGVAYLVHRRRKAAVVA